VAAGDDQTLLNLLGGSRGDDRRDSAVQAEGGSFGGSNRFTARTDVFAAEDLRPLCECCRQLVHDIIIAKCWLINMRS
jgi:hypothetical protein